MAGAALDAVTIEIQNLHAYANFAMNTAGNALNTLENIEVPNINLPDISPSNFEFIDPVSVTPPSPIDLSEIPAIIAIDSVDKPTRPSVSLPSSPTISEADFPDAPELLSPSWATIAHGALFDVLLPSPPDIDLDKYALNFEIPTLSIDRPTSWAFVIGNILIADDPMVKAIQNRLTSNIVNGGTGLSQEIETALWDRDRERSELQLQDSTDKTITAWAKKGFSLPDGLLAHSLSELQKEYLNRNLDRSREIAIKQADLEQTNLFKSMELGVTLSFKLIESLIAYEELLFKSQEATARFANEYIRLQIETYNAILEAYKARIVIYEALIRAAISKVEVYKAQIEGEVARLGINEQTVKIYLAEIEAEAARTKGQTDINLANASIYTAQVQGAVAKSSVNEIRVRRYAEQIRAALVEVEIYRAEVDAMNASLGAEKLKVEANALQIDAWSRGVQAQIANMNSEIEIFKATSLQNISVAELQSKQIEAELRTILAQVELDLKKAEVESKGLQTAAQLHIEAAKQVAQTAGSMAAGALAAVSAQARVSYDENMELTEPA